MPLNHGPHEQEGHSLPLQAVPKHLSLGLWSQLQKAEADQFFDILMTFTRQPDAEDLALLADRGVIFSPFHQANPSRLMPGCTTGHCLVTQLSGIDFIQYIEGVAQLN